jgi:hypothetical protein
MGRLAPIKSTENILDLVVEKLELLNRFSQIEKFPGSSIEYLLSFIPALTLPAAVVIYSGSDISNHPLRTVRVSVAVLTDMYATDDKENLRAHIDAVEIGLDQQISGQAVVFVQGDEALELPGDPACAAALVNLKIEDH